MRFALVAAALLAAAPAAAQTAPPPSNTILHELKGGILAHDVGELWSGFHLEPGVTFNLEAVFQPHLDVLWGSIRPNLGVSATTAGGTSYGYGGAVYELPLPYGIFVGIGLGAAVHDGKLQATDPERKGLGSRVLFHIPIEAGIAVTEHARFSVYFEHVSNGFLASPNEGMDNLGVRVGYKF
jgi:lipid A 3-O-deacylase